MEEQKELGIDLSIASKEMIGALLDEASETGIHEEIMNANAKRPEIIQALIEHPDTPEHIREQAGKLLQVPVLKPDTSVLAPKTQEMRSHNLLQTIQHLSVPEKRLLAMRGGREARTLLLKDTNKQIIMAVLDNPKITESEVEIIAHSRSVSDDALRAIIKNRDWMKNYAILLAVVCNPKTPAGVAIPLLTNLKLKDLVVLEKNKNIAEALRISSKKLVQARKPH